MSVINITNVQVENNPSMALDSFQFTITFESLEELQHDVDWRLTWVTDDSAQDQELDCVAVGPIRRGPMRFKFDADAPPLQQMDADEVHGMSAIVLTGLYKNEEFVRIGWYVQLFYIDPAMNADPPDVPNWSQLKRVIITDEPRLTRFAIAWDDQTSTSTGNQNNHPEATPCSGPDRPMNLMEE